MAKAKQEASLQAAVVKYLRAQYFHALWHSIPNEQLYSGPKAAIAGARLNAMGRRKGVPDLLLINERGECLYLELKTEKGRLSKEQQAFKGLCVVHNTRHATCNNIDVCISIIKEFYQTT